MGDQRPHSSLLRSQLHRRCIQNDPHARFVGVCQKLLPKAVLQCGNIDVSRLMKPFLSPARFPNSAGLQAVDLDPGALFTSALVYGFHRITVISDTHMPRRRIQLQQIIDLRLGHNATSFL